MKNIYRYANGKQLFKLKSISDNGSIYYFECGHWCTDNVFIDLIPTNNQLELL
jgi:hypothetical protein